MSAHASAARVRVRYAETDKMGVVYYANYLVWFEVARTTWLRDTGWSYREMEVEGYALPVIAAACDYRQSARYDDELELRIKVIKQTHVRIDHAYEMLNAATRELLCTGESTIACVDRAGQVQAIPEFLGGKFSI